jgi:glycosyltransferase involved in cell wall biosynthesis
MRLVLLTEIEAPFRIPLFNALAARPEVDLTVLYLSARDPRRNYPGYEHEVAFASEVLPGRDLVAGGRWAVANRGVGRRLAELRPDVVAVGGWNQPAFWQAYRFARRRSLPLLVWIESTGRDARTGNRVWESAKRRFVRGAAGFFVPGTAAADYARSLGIEDDRIAVAPNAPDLGVFGARVAEARQDRDRLRHELGLDGCAFLYVGRLSPEKGADILVRAFAGVPGELVVVGDGPDAKRVRSDAPSTVRFVGRLERDTLPPWFAAADAFVLPSRSDTWGMVLSEAAVAGLPLVASDAAGAAYDLVEEGVNGFRFPVGDEAALRERLQAVAADEGFRRSAGKRSRELAAGHTPEAWAEAVAGLAARARAPRADPG